MFCGLHKETVTHISTTVVNYIITTKVIISRRPDRLQDYIAACKQTLGQGNGFNTQQTIWLRTWGPNAVWNVIAWTQISCGKYMLSAKINGTEHNVWLKFHILLLRFSDLQFILIPTWSSTCSFLLKIGNIYIYVHHNFKLHVKTTAHSLENWLTCCTTGSIIHYMFCMMEL